MVEDERVDAQALIVGTDGDEEDLTEADPEEDVLIGDEEETVIVMDKLLKIVN